MGHGATRMGGRHVGVVTTPRQLARGEGRTEEMGDGQGASALRRVGRGRLGGGGWGEGNSVEANGAWRVADGREARGHFVRELGWRGCFFFMREVLGGTIFPYRVNLNLY